MIQEVTSSAFNKTISVPFSKSYINRALILASLAKRPVEIINISPSTDVLNTVSALRAVGLIISDTTGGLVVENSFPECEKSSEELTVYTGDGGTTNRFLIALLARGKREYHLQYGGEFGKRPMDEYIEVLSGLGSKVTISSTVNVQGPLIIPKSIDVDCSKSTQFATALMLAFADSDVNIDKKNLTSSSMYLSITEKMVAEFKKEVSSYKTPVDFSSLSYPIALALTTGECLISNCFHVDSLQPDSILTDKYKQHIRFEVDGVRVNRATLLGSIDMDCSGCPDLVPTLAYICSYSNGISNLTNLEVLKYKESDRLHEICKLMDLFEVKYELNSNNFSLKIVGNSSTISYKEYNSPLDHRLAMTAYLFMRRNSGGKIINSECVEKSFPDFFKILK